MGTARTCHGESQKCLWTVMNTSSSTVTINKKIAYICIWLIKIIMLLVFAEPAREAIFVMVNSLMK